MTRALESFRLSVTTAPAPDLWYLFLRAGDTNVTIDTSIFGAGWHHDWWEAKK